MKKEKKVEGTGPFVAIQNALEQAPKWSLLLDNLSQILPHQVWLQQFKTLGNNDPKEKKEESGKQRIKVEGQAKNAQAISAFLKSIEDTPFFENVVLKSSDEDKTGLFNFEINCDISESPTS